ncbi:hypothetical protein [Streptomyces sp. NPDC051162]|uniref:hypothetical protein n=1 Tax=unclassified Streptomyces TaxID=2593676 RepID=UPI00342E2B57
MTAASLLVAGCSASGPAPASDHAAAGPAASAADAASTGDQRLAVKAAPDGAAAPSAVAHPTGGGRQAEKSSLKVASFDRESGRAVLADTPRTPAKKPPAAAHPTSPAPSGSAGTGQNSPVAVGDIIASAPAPGAPDGVLAKVTQVLGKTGKGTEVNTAPATLGALLGDAKADGKVPVDPSTMSVEPLVKGTKVSWAKTGDAHFGPKGAQLPLGSLRIDVGTSIATAEDAPASAAASAAGFVQLAPEVDFSYDGRGPGAAGAPGGASLALSGDWSSQWELKGQAAGTTPGGKPLRVPFAKLHAAPVIQVGPVPVVVNLGMTCYLQVDADGKIDVDIKQDLKGDFRVGGSYAHGKGWTPVNSSEMKATSPRATVTAAGKVKAALGAEASVGLYGAVGVTADVAPYLRAEAEGQATAATDGSASAAGRWKAYGGLDLTGALQLQLKIFDTPIFEKPIPLGALHREWKIAEGSGAVSTPGKRRG